MGAPHIHGELLKLGIDIGETSVGKIFLVLAHDRRRIVHFNVAAHPTAEWAGQQLREAFPFDQNRGIYFVTATASLVANSAGMWRLWGSKRSFRLSGRPGERAFVERVIDDKRRYAICAGVQPHHMRGSKAVS